MKKIVLGFAVAAGALALWTACTGSDPSGTGQGAQGEACYANGTCLGGLSCVAKLCVPSDASARTDAPGDAGSDAQDPNTNCRDLGANQKVLCPVHGGEVTCDSGKTCCPGFGCIGATDGTTCTAKPFGCFSDRECVSAPSACCVTAKLDLKAANNCGSRSFQPASGASCKAACDAATELQLCNLVNNGDDTNHRCPDPLDCKGTAITIRGADGIDYVKTIGVCAP